MDHGLITHVIDGGKLRETMSTSCFIKSIVFSRPRILVWLHTRAPGRQCLLHVLSRLLLSADHGSWFDNTFGWWREAQGDNVYLMCYHVYCFQSPTDSGLITHMVIAGGKLRETMYTSCFITSIVFSQPQVLVWLHTWLVAGSSGRQCLPHILSLHILSRLLFSVDHRSWFDYTRDWWRDAQGDNVHLMFYHDYCFQSTTGPGLITHVAGGGKLRETRSTSCSSKIWRKITTGKLQNCAIFYLMFYHDYCFQLTADPGLITHVISGGKLRETMSTSCLTRLFVLVDHGSWFDYTRDWWREAQGDNVYLIFITSIVFSWPRILVWLHTWLVAGSSGRQGLPHVLRRYEERSPQGSYKIVPFSTKRITIWDYW